MKALPALLLTAAAAAASFPSNATAQDDYARRPRPNYGRSRALLSATVDSGPVGNLLAARLATEAARYGDASEALGRAETRLLNDVSAIHAMPPPLLQRALTDVRAAREKAAARQRTPTLQAINDALLALGSQNTAIAGPVGGPPLPSIQGPDQAARPAPYPVVSPAPLPPTASVLYRLDPGHWQLRGAQSVWVDPQTIPQPVSVQPVVAPREVWNGDRWILVPEHFAGTETP